MNVHEERRRHPRVPVQLNVAYDNDVLWAEAHVHDLSPGGAHIATETPLPVGTRLSLAFSSQELQLGLEAQVLRVSEEDPDDPHNVPGMAVQFYDVSPQDEEHLAVLIERHQANLLAADEPALEETLHEEAPTETPTEAPTETAPVLEAAPSSGEFETVRRLPPSDIGETVRMESPFADAATAEAPAPEAAPIEVAPEIEAAPSAPADELETTTLQPPDEQIETTIFAPQESIETVRLEPSEALRTQEMPVFSPEAAQADLSSSQDIPLIPDAEDGSTPEKRGKRNKKRR